MSYEPVPDLVVRPYNEDMKILRIVVGALVALVGCGKSSFDGPGSKAELEHLRHVWGADLPAPDATLIKKAEDLMVYMVAHERLQTYEQSIQREWQPVGAGTAIRHPKFVVDGATDTKARYTKWKGVDGKMRYIVLDYATGVVRPYTPSSHTTWHAGPHRAVGLPPGLSTFISSSDRFLHRGLEPLETRAHAGRTQFDSRNG